MMTEGQRQEFASMLGVMAELYEKSLSALQLDLYWTALREFDLEEVKRALYVHMQSPQAGRFMPRPADIIRHIRGDEETRALEAWSRVKRAAARIGVYRSPVFDDPVIHCVIHDMGGWVRIASMDWPEREDAWMQREFVQRYVGWAARKIERVPGLAGLTELENRRRWPQYVPLPVPVGDRRRCAEVLRLQSDGRELSRQDLTLPAHGGVTQDAGM